MSVWNGLLAGAAGAVVLNVAHELTRHLTSAAPRMDIVGMRALVRGARLAGQRPPEHLRSATLAGDLIANTMYYGLVGATSADGAVLAGGALGAAAGIGGVLLTPRLGLGDSEVRRTRQTQALTVGLYLLGGLIAGLAYRQMVSEGLPVPGSAHLSAPI
jgi:hypothetical protein